MKNILIISGLFLCPSYLFAAANENDRSIQENIRQEQRINKLESQLYNESVKLSLYSGGEKKNDLNNLIIHEKDCFQIKNLKFVVNDPLEEKIHKKLRWLFTSLSQDKIIISQCVGTQSLQKIIRFTQNELIKKGFITTQVVVNPQDLTGGELVINVHLGRINKIISRDQSITHLESLFALPVSKNDILNLPDIEQGLENLKRVAGREIDIKIEPSVDENEDLLTGYSDLFISSKPYKKIGLNIGVDDSGYKTTGRYIGNWGLSINSVLGLNDVLSVNLSHSLDNWNKDLNKSYYINYAIPINNYDFTASFNEFVFEQNSPGWDGPITYRGQNRQANLGLSRLISRSSNYKTSLYVKAYHKTTRNVFGDIDLVSQRRTTTGWNLGIQHRQYIGNGLLDFGIDYRRGTGALKAESAPEEKIFFDTYQFPIEGYARAPLWSADIRYSQPFHINNEPFQYRLNWRGQYAPKVLVAPDRFNIGGRYTVRGFSGEMSLSGDNGHFIQQEISGNSFIPFTQIYVGVDHGWVNGKNSFQNQHHLMGGVFGLRGFYKNIYLDAFAGHGLVAPNTIRKEWVTGFNINFSY